MQRIGQEVGIIIKSPREIAIMRETGRVVAAVIEALAKTVSAGVTTGELDKVADRELKKHGAVSAFKGYRGFPASICTSINEEVVHGIPGSRILKAGDIISLDVGAILDGFYADAAVTLPVGKISAEAQRLIETTEGALQAGIAAARSGARLGDISAAIQSYVESKNFSVVREYVGHGVGRDLHEDPQIPNFGIAGEGLLLKKGMTLALEPMVNAGEWRTRVADNRWTVSTIDGSLSAHFEHTIATTDGSAEILTML
jgi:methionyl aminopeptidase